MQDILFVCASCKVAQLWSMLMYSYWCSNGPKFIRARLHLITAVHWLFVQHALTQTKHILLSMWTNVFMNCQVLWSAREECIVETVEKRDLTLLKWWTIHYDLVFRWLQLFIGQIVWQPLTTCGSEILIESLSLLSTQYQPQATGPTQTFMKEDEKKFHAEKLKTSHERAACKHGPSSS